MVQFFAIISSGPGISVVMSTCIKSKLTFLN